MICYLTVKISYSCYETNTTKTSVAKSNKVLLLSHTSCHQESSRRSYLLKSFKISGWQSPQYQLCFHKRLLHLPQQWDRTWRFAHLGVTQVTYLHISLASASHMAMLKLKVWVRVTLPCICKKRRTKTLASIFFQQRLNKETENTKVNKF